MLASPAVCIRYPPIRLPPPAAGATEPPPWDVGISVDNSESLTPSWWKMGDVCDGNRPLMLDIALINDFLIKRLRWRVGVTWTTMTNQDCVSGSKKAKRYYLRIVQGSSGDCWTSVADNRTDSYLISPERDTKEQRFVLFQPNSKQQANDECVRGRRWRMTASVDVGSGSRWHDVTQLHSRYITSAMPTSCLR